MRIRTIKNGELLALAPEAIRSGLRNGRHASWWDFGSRSPKNERLGDVSVVSILGALEHRDDGWGDSYEAIVRRVADAITGQDAVRAAMDTNSRAQWDDRVEPVQVPDATPPKAVVLRIDSPGGVCAGMNETVARIRAMAAKYGVTMIAYADELAASAAYALACSCDEIYLPRSGVVGSIGVISTMYDQVEADKKFGLNFRTITSGARKADGYPHQPLSADAIAAEQGRVSKLAAQFYGIVAKARGLSPKAIAAFEAGIFLGKDATRAGLADGLATFEDVVAGASEAGAAKPAGGAKRQRDTASAKVCHKILAQRGTRAVRSGLTARKGAPNRATAGADTARAGKDPEIATMFVQLRALVKKLTAEHAEATGAKRKALALKLADARADLAAATKIKHKVEEYTEESDDDSDEDEKDEGDEEAAEDGDESAEDETSDDSAEDESAEESAESEESDGEAASLASLAHRVTGKRGAAAVGALAALIAEGGRASKQIAAIQAERAKEQKANLITEALNARAVVPHEAAHLRKQPLSFVRAFLDMRRDPKGKYRSVVNASEDALHVPDPKGKAATGEGALPASTMQHIEMALAAQKFATPKARDDMRAKLIQSHVDRLAKQSHGGERY